MPSSASGETLAERARRILGLDLDGWLSAELRQSDDVPSQGNRSKQVADAQRKHRQRTQSYIQALEQEVLRLRKAELTLKEEIKEAYRDAHHAMHQSQDAPAVMEVDESATATVSVEQNLAIDWNAILNTTPEPACCISAAESTPVVGDQFNAGDQYQMPTWPWALSFDKGVGSLDQPLPIGGLQVRKTPLDPQMGLDLILLLERPCLGHLHNSSTTDSRREGYVAAHVPYNWGTRHAYNLSTRLVHNLGPAESISHNQITNTDLDKLLEASERLYLPDELTPVQVWALVRKLDEVIRMDPDLVSAMFTDLSKYSYCNSFGSAISKSTVKAAFAFYLGCNPPDWRFKVPAHLD
ncbi:uncharacterized protein JN550_013090 [Neoarthrinium moseri]|uniref:uncharacterized protein n=1 Tax=Neoarthrinium moseri TaxID=1658444 RepID=UPI001FDB6F5C|nr:uncharacterized protein JN550_013090 [Neoarthrinium moseri]KAI1857754.1 hypothetical protein JN550_013090 [Neoarthrinium moseri]